jgi:ATP-dependent Clp protease ATP-binding subunit ClpA
MNEKISLIERYAEDFTKKVYYADPAIARENEIKQMILILFTPEKSPILVGKPGIGKTALVEGLAYRIQNNMVPDALKGYTILKIDTAALVGNIEDETGTSDMKLQILVKELQEMDKVILFIDETHTLIGNKTEGGLDFANILKPALARGNIKMIGATTSDEYDYYIVKDKAFLRRLQKIEVSEPDGPSTVKILVGTIPKIEKQTGVMVKYTNFNIERIMQFIVEMTVEYNRVFESASRYPDVCLTILTKAFSYAIFDNKNVLEIKHIYDAIVNTEVVYPDVKKKYIPIFKERFIDIIEKENAILE